MPHPVQSEPSWTTVPDSEPAKYTRPLQGPELMHDCSDRLNDGLSEVVMGATFKSTLSNAELQSRAYEAIGRMRFIIPILACSVQPDPNDPFSSSFIYTTPQDTADLRSWISNTLSVRKHESPIDPEVFVAEMNARTLPYVHSDGHEQITHFYLLVDSTTSVANGNAAGLEERIHGLFMHGPHTLMDAFPTLRCLDALLGWIANPPVESIEKLAWGEEWKSLPVPPITATGGIRDDWDTDGVKVMKEIGEALMHPVPTHSLIPPRSTITVQGKMTHVHAKFDREMSARVVRAAKALGFTPSALFDAAVCVATFKKNPVKPEDTDKAHFTFDPTVIAQDRYLVPPHNGLSHFIAGLCLVVLRIPYTSIPHASSPREQLIAVMAQLKPQLDHYLQNPNLPHVLPAQLVYHPPRMAKDISNPCLSITSNMGNVSRLLKDKEVDGRKKVVEVVDMVFGHRLPWQRILFHCWSLNGEMRFQVQTSDVWDEPDIRSYLSDVQDLMLSILDSSTPSPTSAPVTVAIDSSTPSGANSIADPTPPEGVNVLPYPGDHFTPTTHHTTYPAIAPHPTDLTGRVAFVSAASSEAGKAAVIALAHAGAKGIVITARSSKMDALDDLEKEISHISPSTTILKLPMDVLDSASIASAVSHIRSSFGMIDTLLNVAGYIDSTVPISETEPDEWWKAFETNMRGTFAVTQALLPLIKESKSEVKWIVNYASTSAFYTAPVCSGYLTSKFALLRLTEILHTELTSQTTPPISILALHIGVVRSPLSLRSMPATYHHTLIDSPELGAQSIVWLVKERRDWLSGRFVSSNWDMVELVQRKEDVEKGDLLKMKFSF